MGPRLPPRGGYKGGSSLPPRGGDEGGLLGEGSTGLGGKEHGTGGEYRQGAGGSLQQSLGVDSSVQERLEQAVSEAVCW